MWGLLISDCKLPAYLPNPAFKLPPLKGLLMFDADSECIGFITSVKMYIHNCEEEGEIDYGLIMN